MNSMRIVLLGPPGAGKGTQAAKIAEFIQVPRISTGDILRHAIREETALGVEARGYMNQGKLVPDAIMMGIVKQRLSLADCKNGFILDGLPRTVVQARELQRVTAVDLVVAIDVKDCEIIRRLTGRRYCPSCEAGYHVEFQPPRVANQCDHCGAELKKRDDDNEEIIAQRLKTYREWTAPLLAFYEKENLLSVVDGHGDASDVFERIKELLPKT